MAPDQAPGEKGFGLLLRSGLEALGIVPSNADIWTVLRSSDQDLNVLAVPKLSGAKLDAAVYWTLQKEKKFADADYALDYVPLGAAQGGARLEALTCLACKADVDRLHEAFEQAGLPLAGITAIPNAFMALYRAPGAPRRASARGHIHVEPDSPHRPVPTDRSCSAVHPFRGGSMAVRLAEHFRLLAKPKPAPLAELELQLPRRCRRRDRRSKDSALEEPPHPIDPALALDLLRHALQGSPRPPGPVRSTCCSQGHARRHSTAIERLDGSGSAPGILCWHPAAALDALHLSGEIFRLVAALARPWPGQTGLPAPSFSTLGILRAEGARSPPETAWPRPLPWPPPLPNPGGITSSQLHGPHGAGCKNFVTRCITWDWPES
jgi:hypothetical protein